MGGGLLHTVVALAWSVNLPPGSAVSLHPRPALRDFGRASAFDLPAPPPDALVELVRRLRGGGIPFAASITGSLLGLPAKIMGRLVKGWLRNQARDPVLYILIIAVWKDLRHFRNETRLELRKLDPLITENASQLSLRST